MGNLAVPAVSFPYTYPLGHVSLLSSFGWPISFLAWILVSLWNCIISWITFPLFWFLQLDDAYRLWPQDLKDFVRPAGEVTYADVDRQGTGYHLSLSFHPLTCRVVDFESSDDVANAIRKLDGSELKGKRVRLSEDAVHTALVRTYVLECKYPTSTSQTS